MKLLNLLSKKVQVAPIKEPDHQHVLELISKTYAAPRKEVTGGDAKTIEKALFGVTTLLWQCKVCSEFTKEELLGSDTSTLDELIEKAEEYGPQYIQQGDKTYVVVRYVPPTQQGGNVPVR